VLRYGQLYGPSKYSDLKAWYKKATDPSQELKSAHGAKFGTNLSEEEFNRRQVFVVMTNGLDYETREAIQYWRSCGLDIQPWVYRIYEGQPNEMLLEMSAFRVEDNPYEDIAEGYYILNTNVSNDEKDHDDMLANHKAAAYFDPWKYKIERLARGDVVYLYQSAVGIVAMGKARAMGDALEMLTYNQKHCPTKQSSGRLSATADFCVGTKKSLNKDYCDKSIQKV